MTERAEELKRGALFAPGHSYSAFCTSSIDSLEHLDVADVIGMGVRHRDDLDVRGLHAELFELACQRLRAGASAVAFGFGRFSKTQLNQ